MNTSERAHEVVAMLIAGTTDIGSPHLKIVSDRTERDARIARAQDKIEAALQSIRRGEINLAKRHTEDATQILRRVRETGFDPSDDENCGQP